MISRNDQRTNSTRHLVAATLTTIAFGVAAFAQAPTPPADELSRESLHGGVGPLSVPPMLPDVSDLDTIPIDPTLRELASLLDDPSYERRERALSELQGAVLDVRQLCAILETDDLTPEQRYRLLTVLRSQLKNEPRGALGIRMTWQQKKPDEPGFVEINTLLPGLPAEKVLKPSDKIMRVDSHELFYQNDLIVLVQSKKPGERIRLDILRPRTDAQGQLVEENGRIALDPMVVEFELGSAKLLRDPESGNISPVGAVGEQRVKEALIASRRYAPQPKEIEIAAGQHADLLASEIAPSGDDERIDRHPVIQEVVMERLLIERGELNMTFDLRRRWQLRLDDIRNRSQDPNLSESESALLHRVAVRLERLIRP